MSEVMYREGHFVAMRDIMITLSKLKTKKGNVAHKYIDTIASGIRCISKGRHAPLCGWRLLLHVFGVLDEWSQERKNKDEKRQQALDTEILDVMDTICREWPAAEKVNVKNCILCGDVVVGLRRQLRGVLTEK